MQITKCVEASPIDAEIIRVEPRTRAPGRGDRPAGRRPCWSSSVGTGKALLGDVWLEVGPGDRLAVDAGEPCALRSIDRPGLGRPDPDRAVRPLGPPQAA